MSKCKLRFSKDLTGCPFVHLKGLIVDARKADQFNQQWTHRGHFFKHWDDNADWYLENLNSRWLISVLDTLVDWGETDHEKASALMCVTFLTQERTFETLKRIHKWKTTTPKQQAIDEQFARKNRIWNGLSEVAARSSCDVYRNLTRRWRKTLSPRVKQIWDVMLSRYTGWQGTLCQTFTVTHERNILGDINRLWTTEVYK